MIAAPALWNINRSGRATNDASGVCDFSQGMKFENAFNPYSDRCDVHDVADAPGRRCRALLEDAGGGWPIRRSMPSGLAETWDIGEDAAPALL